MGIERVPLEKAVCDGCGDYFNEENCVEDAARFVRDHDGHVYPDGRVLCYDCMTPDDRLEADGPGYYPYEDEWEYLRAWGQWKQCNESLRAHMCRHRKDVPEPLGWAHWQRQATPPAHDFWPELPARDCREVQP